MVDGDEEVFYFNFQSFLGLLHMVGVYLYSNSEHIAKEKVERI